MATKLTTSGMRHVALNVTALEDCLTFYTEVIGMAIEWQPDSDNVFLCSGNDNLALHRIPGSDPNASSGGGLDQQRDRLDHIVFIIDNIDDIDRWYQHLQDQRCTATTRTAPWSNSSITHHFPAGKELAPDASRIRKPGVARFCTWLRS